MTNIIKKLCIDCQAFCIAVGFACWCCPSRRHTWETLFRMNTQAWQLSKLIDDQGGRKRAKPGKLNEHPSKRSADAAALARWGPVGVSDLIVVPDRFAQ
jgi:hypothetical protein